LKNRIIFSPVLYFYIKAIFLYAVRRESNPIFGSGVRCWGETGEIAAVCFEIPGKQARLSLSVVDEGFSKGQVPYGCDTQAQAFHEKKKKRRNHSRG
jgi:hypothetical protein